MEVKIFKNTEYNKCVLSLNNNVGKQVMIIVFDEVELIDSKDLNGLSLRSNGVSKCTVWDEVATQVLEFWEKNK